MSEETQETTWSGLKKTIIGTLATVVTAGGAWVGTTLFGGGEEITPAPVQQAAPVINITQQQSAPTPAPTTVIHEKTVEKVVPVETKKEEKKEKEEEPW
jgi:alpha/beta superfamily hydrolase